MNRRPAPAPKRGGSRSSLILGMILGLAIPLVTWASMLVWERWGQEYFGEGEATDPWIGEYIPMGVPRLIGEPEPARIIYLNREGARLTGGADDSPRNVSTLVRGAGLTEAEIPSFAGTNRRWREILACVRDRFSPYDVRIVDQRPVDSDYVMVMVGGRPEVLDDGDEEVSEIDDTHDHTKATGLAPYNGQAVEDAIVMVFSRKLRENARRTCETVAMEVAHAYGLDHAMHCGELTSYLRPCGRRRFRDEELPCGEQEARPCSASPGNTQNSHQRLLEVLGPSGE